MQRLPWSFLQTTVITNTMPVLLEPFGEGLSDERHVGLPSMEWRPIFVIWEGTRKLTQNLSSSLDSQMPEHLFWKTGQKTGHRLVWPQDAMGNMAHSSKEFQA